MNDEVRTGQCLCGAVGYTLSGPLEPPMICHCRECQRQSGHAWAAVTAPLEAVKLREEGSLRWYRASAKARRGFCEDCGSFLFWQEVGAETIDISMGSLDQRDDIPLVGEIWCSERAPYSAQVGKEGVPQHEKGAPED